MMPWVSSTEEMYPLSQEEIIRMRGRLFDDNDSDVRSLGSRSSLSSTSLAESGTSYTSLCSSSKGMSLSSNGYEGDKLNFEDQANPDLMQSWVDDQRHQGPYMYTREYGNSAHSSGDSLFNEKVSVTPLTSTGPMTSSCPSPSTSASSSATATVSGPSLTPAATAAVAPLGPVRRNIPKLSLVIDAKTHRAGYTCANRAQATPVDGAPFDRSIIYDSPVMDEALLNNNVLLPQPSLARDEEENKTASTVTSDTERRCFDVPTFAVQEATAGPSNFETLESPYTGRSTNVASSASSSSSASASASASSSTTSSPGLKCLLNNSLHERRKAKRLPNPLDLRALSSISTAVPMSDAAGAGPKSAVPSGAEGPVSRVVGVEGSQQQDRMIGRLMLKQQVETKRSEQYQKKRPSLAALNCSVANTNITPSLASAAPLSDGTSISGSHLMPSTSTSKAKPTRPSPLLRCVTVHEGMDTTQSNPNERPLVATLRRTEEDDDLDDEEAFPYEKGPREIIPGIWLGSEMNASDTALLKSKNISSILNVAKECLCPFENAARHPHLDYLKHASRDCGSPTPTVRLNDKQSLHSVNKDDDEMSRTSSLMDKSNEYRSNDEQKCSYEEPPMAQAAALQMKYNWLESFLDSETAKPYYVHPTTEDPELDYLWVKWSHNEANLVDSGEFDRAFVFLDAMREQNRNVLIHCQCGVSRSATVTIAYIMRETARKAFTQVPIKSMHDAYSFVKQKSSWIGPNLGLVFQLVAYERKLKDMGSFASDPANHLSNAVSPQVEAGQPTWPVAETTNETKCKQNTPSSQSSNSVYHPSKPSPLHTSTVADGSPTIANERSKEKPASFSLRAEDKTDSLRFTGTTHTLNSNAPNLQSHSSSPSHHGLNQQGSQFRQPLLTPRTFGPGPNSDSDTTQSSWGRSSPSPGFVSSSTTSPCTSTSSWSEFGGKSG